VKRRGLWIVIVVNLLVLLALAFVYPQLMVSPGPLVPEHAALASDCFACHAPLRGASADRCMACHAPPDIGLRTSKGVAIKTVSAAGAGKLKAAFHQELTEPNCMACHSDHAGPKLTQRSRKPFSHALLRVASRSSCETCHAAPRNAMHKNLSVGCAQCHQAEAWKPATFDHAKLFVLDRNHNAACATCHVGGDHSKYTCYGCHEHTPANIARKHINEGIQNFENCVECHRSANGDAQGKGSREGEGDRKSSGRD
jgi:hypothetical protein